MKHEIFGLNNAQVRLGLTSFHTSLNLLPSVAVERGNFGVLLELPSYNKLPTAYASQWSIQVKNGKIYLLAHSRNNDTKDALVLELLELDKDNHVLCKVPYTDRKVYIRLTKRLNYYIRREANLLEATNESLYNEFMERDLFHDSSYVTA